MEQRNPTTLEDLRQLISREGDRLTPRMRDAARYAIACFSPIAKDADLGEMDC